MANAPPKITFTDAGAYGYKDGDIVELDVWRTPWWFTWLRKVMPDRWYNRIRRAVGVKLGRIELVEIRNVTANTFEVK